MTLHLKPTLMGAAMGLMMLWMLHETIMGDSTDINALIVFVGMHLAVLTIALIVTRYASRLSPSLSRVLSKLHRPSSRHMLSMLAGMVIAIGTTHVVAHGWAH